MKLLRYGPAGKEKPGLLDATGALRDLSAVVPDIGPAQLSDAALARLAKLKTDKLPLVRGRPRIGCPVAGVGKFIAIGLNYADHAAEAGLPVPAEPILFNKSSATYCGPNDPILYSRQMTKLDWEVELGVVIGKRVLDVAPERALDHVLGYTVVNDVSERAWQMERGGQWVKGKSYPNFCPTGPYLVTADEVPDPQNLSMWLDVGGTRMQTGSTRNMIFDVRTIVAYMSEFCQLEPGDLICTGTPPGVGAGMKPPRYLAVGEVVELGIEGLGQQRQVVEPVR